jgi:hypothetical protein
VNGLTNHHRHESQQGVWVSTARVVGYLVSMAMVQDFLSIVIMASFKGTEWHPKNCSVLCDFSSRIAAWPQYERSSLNVERCCDREVRRQNAAARRDGVGRGCGFDSEKDFDGEGGLDI